MDFVVARSQCTRFDQLWAFKYDSQLQGISAQADVAADNVNLRLTPDETNRDPASLGLIVYKARAPSDWAFRTCNTHSTRIARFLDVASTKPA